MQTTKHPYELLVRWDQSGALSGAQIQYRYVITGDDGAAIGETVGSAEPLTLETAAGFPLGDLLSQAQVDALAAANAAFARIAALEAQLAALQPADQRV